MVLPTSVEWGSAAVELCADELGTHGCALPAGGALASRRARAAACQVPKRKAGRRARGPVAFVPVRRRLPKGPGEYFGRLGRSTSELDFREELVDIA